MAKSPYNLIIHPLIKLQVANQQKMVTWLYPIFRASNDNARNGIEVTVTPLANHYITLLVDLCGTPFNSIAWVVPSAFEVRFALVVEWKDASTGSFFWCDPCVDETDLLALSSTTPGTWTNKDFFFLKDLWKV